MTSKADSGPDWGNQYRLVASEKWKAKSAAMGQPVTDALVEYAQPAPGMQVLDLASGTGEPAISLASRVGEQGHVTALDLSAGLAGDRREARTKARGSRTSPRSRRTLTACLFPDNSFDLATSRFGVMFFRRPDRCVAGIAPCVAAGSAGVFSGVGVDRAAVLAEHDGRGASACGWSPAASRMGRIRFKFSQPGSLSAIFRSAGFNAVEEETKTLPWTWPGSVEELWEYSQSVSVPFRPMLERVPAEKWPQIHADVHAAVRQYWDGEKVAFGVSVVLASGKK